MGNKIYLIRHAEVAKPKEKIFAGSIDLMLSPVGIHQAQELGRGFSRLGIKKVFCSNLSRAINTASIIAEHCSCGIEILDGIREINLGEWEGKAFSEVMDKHPNEFEERGREIFSYKTPGGESFCEVSRRAVEVFNKVAQQVFYNDKFGNVIIVSHAGVNKALISELTSRKFEECFTIKQPYGCVNVVTMDDHGFCVLENITLEQL